MNTNIYPCPYIIDIEASGFGSHSYPIEVGVVKSSGERYCTLIQPHDSWKHWSNEAEALHGISRETVQHKGKPISTVCAELNAFLSTDEVFSDAWSHDQAWLAKLYRAANVAQSFSIRAIEFILTEEQFFSWDATKEQVFSSHQKERHRASTDARLLQLTYLACVHQNTHVPEFGRPARI